MSRKEFVHLHLHSDFSLLDGAIQHDALAEHASKLGFSAMAATDHGNMFGAMSFYNSMKKHNVRPIIGMEAYVARGSMHERGTNTEGEKGTNHLILLAKNQTGYENLVILTSLAYTKGYYYKPRMDKELLSKHSEGLVALSACMSGVPASLILRDKMDRAVCEVGEYQEIFGKGNYFLELQCHDGFEEQQSRVNAGLTEIARKLDVPLVVTNDAHFLTRDDFRAHQALLCLQTGKTIDQATMHYSPTHYVRSAEEMWHLFENQNVEALRNTMKIAEMCQFGFPKAKMHLPEYPVPEGFTIDSYFEKVAREGLESRLHELAPLHARGELKYSVEQYRARLDHEIATIKKMGFCGYFLIVWDFIRYARDNGIPVGPGRGSAAGAIVAYAMRITDIDPLQFELLFERFLNPERVSMPDIDVDFCVRGRGQVIDYVGNFYGRENVSQIVTFGTMASRAAIKDVGRVLDIPYAEVEKIAKMIPPPQRGRNVPIGEALKTVPELKTAYEKDTRIREMLNLAQRLEGCSRHSSIHAAGVVISPRPVYELVPVFKTKAKDKERGEIDVLATQYNMNDLEKAGMLKMDFLGLTTLTIINDCLENIQREQGQAPNLNEIPLDDPAALRLFADGETEAIFQFEGDGIKEITRRLKPESLEDIIALNALYRPGPLDSGMVDDYIERRHGRKKVRYDFPELKDILGNTFGVCVAGDTLVLDAHSGKRVRIDELESQIGTFYVQGVDQNLNSQIGQVTHFFDNGLREVVELKLRNGSSVKVTQDHQVLTETGWRQVKDLQVNDFIATPRRLTVANEQDYNRQKLRVLAYLIADGSLSSAACCDFVSKDEALLQEFQECVQAFERIETRTLQQLRGVTRVGVVGTQKKYYHEPNDVLAYLRDLGLKYRTGGCRSDQKFVPDFVFGLNSECIGFFLASLWDCDGHLGPKLYHYKTISHQLALDVQTLLLRLGIHSVIYESVYEAEKRKTEPTTAYQVTVYNLHLFRELVGPFLVSKSFPPAPSISYESRDSVSRQIFLTELEQTWSKSWKSLEREYDFSVQHLRPKKRAIPRISISAICSVIDPLNLAQTQTNLKIRWEEIVSIQPAGTERVYDITVEGIHNFVGNNIVLHNCTYQEQIMAIFQKLAGYSLGEADLVRRAMGKKKREELDAHKAKFFQQAEDRGHDRGKLEKLWQSLEGFADYAFNKCLAGDAPIVDADTGQIVTISEIAEGTVSTSRTFSFDGSQIITNEIIEAFPTGEKEVVELELENGRTLRCTLDHKFFTDQGYLPLKDIIEQNLEIYFSEEVEAFTASSLEAPGQYPQNRVTIRLKKMKLVRVNPSGTEKTYNMTMREPHHNYFTNGILTANSHSACYGVLAYQTAYLKAYYPAHFWAAVLSNELNNTDKVAKYIERARAQGIEILPPDVNLSYHGFTSTEKTIRFGLMAIKGIGEAAVDAIVEARKDGPFTSIYDLAKRVDSRALNRRVLESLIKSGGLDEHPGTRAQKFAAIESVMESGARAQRDAQSGQVSLFGMLEAEMEADADATLPDVPPWSQQEQLAGEKATLGFYITGHPLASYRELLGTFSNVSYETLNKCQPNQTIKMGGMVVGYVVKNTKKGDRFCVFSLEDELGSIEVIAWPETFKRISGKISDTQAVLVTGRIEFTDDGPSKIIADDVEPLAGLRERSASLLTFYFRSGSITAEKVDQLRSLFDRHRGDCQISFEVQLPTGDIACVRPNQFVRVKSSPELVQAVQNLCAGCEVRMS
ncbi:MAG TPA: DNA polymerase III subunit alpha [Acidobacteriota bacterium]|nr:DNA polymerase III subunit alpha [Acidobacteriota bacterium]